MNFALEQLSTGPLHTNSYLLVDNDSKQAALFDVGGPIDSLLQIILNESLQLKYIFCTHGHFDHILGIKTVKLRFSDVPVCIHAKEMAVIEHSGAFARLFEFDPRDFGEPDIYINDRDTFQLGNLEIQAILAPGHTPGSICFHFDNVLISGDVLFRRGVGRTDLYGGSFEQLEKSIKKLYTLPEETIVYPGHGPSTTIGEEKRDNPFISL